MNWIKPIEYCSLFVLTFLFYFSLIVPNHLNLIVLQTLITTVSHYCCSNPLFWTNTNQEEKHFKKHIIRRQAAGVVYRTYKQHSLTGAQAPWNRAFRHDLGQQYPCPQTLALENRTTFFHALVHSEIKTNRFILPKRKRLRTPEP